jgi:ubiquinone/menaquinone biosynthesis C-methylase UbiE
VAGAHPQIPQRAVDVFELEIPDGEPDSPLEVEICNPAYGMRERRRLGRWTFGGAGAGAVLLSVDWLAGGESMVRLSSAAGGRQPEVRDSDFDEGTVVGPRMEVQVTGAGLAERFEVQVTDAEALKEYYSQESHQEDYKVEHPFFDSFHRARLRTLERMFRKYIAPGSRVLDVGSGYSMFFQITTDWPFDLTCCDLDSAAMEKMRGMVPQWKWVVSDAVRLPFEDASFDALYAGEIIEHVSDADAALREWGRLLAPGGVLILTTPNRDRLLARANRSVMVMNPEHVRELSLPELKDSLREQGFRLLHVTGIYLELVVNWHRPPGLRLDMMVRLYDQPRHVRAYDALMWMGRLLPSRAFDLVVVCRKP